MLEAMSVGCPVVTTSNCMLPQIIQDGINGFITNDPAQMRKRLTELLRDKELAARIGQAGRETVIHKFGDSLFIQRWNEVFRQATGRPII
jgi:rhamnosyl/mannosyltransferase